ncbi:Uncharacterized conserved protein, contains NRDE domain [Halogranum rubrum]|uniref:Uncharacterized conserved protein, contains NRDE domain n=1 Tax=Halogranum rubrum TaxID=553466 RepID=A0A1I4EQ82_9EURY|nr:NRDE family protein [Halogranum rubrum]SFL07373.1 Uncharacterized conserved protein, contains NRDE domain [Halogranum rubrum]
MCTLTIAWQVFDEAPVVVAANRDEALDRPAEAPAKIEDDPGVVAPRDVEAGGTWVGYNEHGLFVGVTNRWVTGLKSERSRGLLVRDALRRESAEAALELVEEAVKDHEYEGFNLVVADADAAYLLEWDGHLHVRQYEPGVHVVVNVGTDDSFFVPDRRPDIGRQQAANARAVREALRPEDGETGDEWVERAAGVLGDHEYGVCIHADRYGTRSSSLITLGRDTDGSLRARYQFAPGPPCETEYLAVESQV